MLRSSKNVTMCNALSKCISHVDTYFIEFSLSFLFAGNVKTELETWKCVR